MNIRLLLSLSESDKRWIITILLVVILLLAIFGFISYITVRLMKWQSKKMDTLIHDVVVTRVITDRKRLVSYGRKKNLALFFRQALIPFNIVVFGLLIWIIKCAVIRDFSYNPFSTVDGFGTLFWTWKFSGEYTDGTLIKFAILTVDNTPHMVASAWAGYIAGPCFIIGGAWYFVVSSSLVARSIKFWKRSRELFEKSLDGFNASEASNDLDKELNK